MRWLIALGVVLAVPRDVEAACVDLDNLHSSPGELVEANPPSELAIEEVRITRSDGGSECAPSTKIVIQLSATDDTTPSDRIAVRVRIDDFQDDRFPDGEFLKIRFREEDANLDFDLGLSAVDRSGNVGPETVIPIYDQAGCNAGSSWSLLPGLAVLALLTSRRFRSRSTATPRASCDRGSASAD